MSLWSGSSYEGDYKDGWYHGQGRFKYPNGVVYEGGFVKGEFHGEGQLIYPNGGSYRATWANGKMQQGDYYFKDQLKYEHENWKYCLGNDRKFYQEQLRGIKPAGDTQMTKDDILKLIPEGTYGKLYIQDVGEGYYEPIKSVIFSYEGNIIRTPSQAEAEDIIAKCRYNPKKNLNISGQQDKIIQKVIEQSQ